MAKSKNKNSISSFIKKLNEIDINSLIASLNKIKLDDLKKINTYDQGYVHLTQDMFHRGENNDVISISN